MKTQTNPKATAMVLQTSAQAKGEWVQGLDSIRFVLAMIVFLSHLGNEPANFLKSFDNKILWFFGVLVNHLYLGPGAVVGFFIISGFVIHYPFKDRQLNVRKFLVRRWLRIGLPLTVAVVIALCLGNIKFIPIWSLYCELIYYTIYPVLRRLPLTWTLQFWIAFFISMILMITLGWQSELRSMFDQTNINYTGSYAALGDGLTWLVGLPCWLIGVLIAEHVDSIKREISHNKIWFIRSAVLAAAIIIVAAKAHWYISYLFTLNFYSFFLGYWLFNEILFFRDHRPPKALEYAGRFSYSLYLLHVIFVHLLAITLATSPAMYPLKIVLTIGLSYLFFLLVENPSHKLSKFLAEKVD